MNRKIVGVGFLLLLLFLAIPAAYWYGKTKYLRAESNVSSKLLREFESLLHEKQRNAKLCPRICQECNVTAVELSMTGIQGYWRTKTSKFALDSTVNIAFETVYPNYISLVMNNIEVPVIADLGRGQKDRHKIWRSLFPKAKILAVHRLITSIRFEPTLETAICDMSLGNDVDKLIEKIRRLKTNVMVDNASFHPDHQLIAFKRLFQALQDGGLYIVENIATSYWKDGSSIDVFSATDFHFVRWALGAAEMLNSHNLAKKSSSLEVLGATDIAEIIFGDNVIIFRKVTDRERTLRAFLKSKYKVENEDDRKTPNQTSKVSNT